MDLSGIVMICRNDHLWERWSCRIVTLVSARSIDIRQYLQILPPGECWFSCSLVNNALAHLTIVNYYIIYGFFGKKFKE